LCICLYVPHCWSQYFYMSIIHSYASPSYTHATRTHSFSHTHTYTHNTHHTHAHSHTHSHAQSGGLASSSLHIARAVCRRTERHIIPLIDRGDVDRVIGTYVNRLFHVIINITVYCLYIIIISIMHICSALNVSISRLQTHSHTHTYTHTHTHIHTYTHTHIPGE